MTKQELKDVVSNNLKENDMIIECTTPGKSSDILRVITKDEDDFTIRINTTDDAQKNIVRENLIPLILSVAVLGLFDLGIITKKNADKYIKALGQNVDEIKTQ